MYDQSCSQSKFVKMKFQITFAVVVLALAALASAQDPPVLPPCYAKGKRITFMCIRDYNQEHLILQARNARNRDLTRARPSSRTAARNASKTASTSMTGTAIGFRMTPPGASASCSRLARNATSPQIGPWPQSVVPNWK